MRRSVLRTALLVATSSSAACGLLVGVDFDRAHPRSEADALTDADPNADGDAPIVGFEAGDVATDRDACCPPPRAVAAGASHTCALLGDGAVRCWGDNRQGQLGIPPSDASTAPVSVANLEPASALALGDGYSCALVDGGARCWGLLGNPTGVGLTFPDQFMVPGARHIAAGGRHVCFRVSTGGVRCMGDDTQGQLGDDQTGSFMPSLVDVVRLAPVVAPIAAGGAHTCAVTADAGVACWGANGDGQLGTGSTTPGVSAEPLAVQGLPPTNDIASGTAHVCAKLSSGGAMCWGFSLSGSLGNGDAQAPEGTPVNVVGLSTGVRMLTAGTAHTCALAASPTPLCWGPNFDGQLGNGDFGVMKSGTPLSVVGLAGAATGIGAGGRHACAIVGSGVVCWGRNELGQLGDGTTKSSASAVTVKGL